MIAARPVASDDLARRMVEIDEKLLTHGPVALDFALLLAERKQVYESLHPETRHGGDRKSASRRAKIKTQTISFCSDAAHALNMSERAVQLAVALGEAFEPAEVEALRRSHIADNAASLRAVAALTGGERTAMISALAAQGRFRQALIDLGLYLQVEPQERLFQSFVAQWAQAAPRTRRRMLDHAGVDPTIARETVASTSRRKTRGAAPAQH